MTALSTVITRERLTLAGDALLLTAATFAAVTGLLALAVGAGPTDGNRWVEGLSAVFSLGSVIAGPIIAWRLHGRRITRPALLGGVLGVPGGALLTGPFLGLFAGLGMLVSLVTGSEVAGPATVLGLAGLGLAFLTGWLVRDGVRDLARERKHLALDRARIAAAAALLVVVAGSLLWAALTPDVESVELVAFAALGGLSGAAIVIGAEVATAIVAGRRPGPVRRA